MEKIDDFITKYEKGDVKIGDKVSYSQKQIINENLKFRNSFFDNPVTLQGDKKLFYNVVTGFARTLINNSIIKINELRLTPIDGEYLKLLDILRGGMHHYLRFNNFADLKQLVVEELVEMGHVVIKIVEGEMYLVPLTNIIFKPNSKSLKFEDHIEKLEYTYEEAKLEFGETKNWEEIEKYFKKNGEIKILEYWVNDFLKVNGKEKFTKICIKYLDRSLFKPDETDNKELWEPYLELDRFESPEWIEPSNTREKRIYGDKVPVFPYEEARFMNVEGRYMGMGVRELTADLQRDYNEKRNNKRSFDKIAMSGLLVHKIGIMRTQNDKMSELMRKLQTGDVLKIFADENIQPLNAGSITSDTEIMANGLFELIRFILGVTPTAIGQKDSNTTAAFAVIQNQNQQSVYETIKNRTARLYERLFQDFVLEDILEGMLSQDVLQISLDGEDLDELDDFLVKNEVDSELERIKPLNMNEEVYNEVLEGRKKQVKENKDLRFINLKDKKVKQAFKKLIKELRYRVEFNATNEFIDPNVKIKTLLDSDKIQNKQIRNIILSEVGISQKIIKNVDEESEMLAQQQMQQQMPTQSINNMPQLPTNPNV